MELRVIEPGFAYMIESILDFQQENTAPFWSDPLYYFYPQLNKDYASRLSLRERQDYISRIMAGVYRQERENLQQKAEEYSQYWHRYQPQIEAALSDAFQTDCSEILNDMLCRVSLNPIEPRFPREHGFDVFWKNSGKGFLGEAIHEMIHLVWFHVWHQVFEDDWEEYETPSLKWILSEMVVEPIMSDPRLADINPYYPRENGGCIYPYFFDMNTGGRNTMEVLRELYRSRNIRDFMTDSYAYCQKYEQQIRDHIAKAENRT